MRGPALKDMSEPLTVIKVSGQSNTRTIAAAIAHCVRSGRPSIDVTGFNVATVNTILKAAAVARDYLKREGKDMRLQIQHRTDESGRKSLFFIAHSLDSRSKEAAADGDEDMNNNNEYRVAPATDPAKLAGAVKARLNEGHSVSLFCIGPASLFRGATAVALLASYLQKDVYVLNAFVKFTGRGQMTSEMNGVRMTVTI
jgi:stage V sporulation protein SpoVS